MPPPSCHGGITGLWMEGLNQQVPDIKATTMVDDNRLYVVGTENFRTFEEAIEYAKHMMKKWATCSAARHRRSQHC